jgi:phospholipid/cholesterol/gamma-HCH transport system substrate-binding protein
MPSQKQVRWAQLRVGLTVIFAGAVLAVLIFLMTGSGGFFTPKITLRVYFDDAQGLRAGAPVNLQGVPIGNVTDIRVVEHGNTPVRVLMRIPKKSADEIPVDSSASLTSAGVLGETFVNIDRTLAKSKEKVRDGAEIPVKDSPNLQDVVKSTQTSLQNVDVLVRRVDRIVNFIESGQGSIGKLIYDQGLYNRLNSTLNEVQGMVSQIASGKGSIGKFIASDEIYNKAYAAVDKLDKIIGEIEAGRGTAGKFIKDPSLYDNANQTIAKANALMDDVNAGKGALGKFAKDEQFAAKLDNTLTKLSAIMTSLEAGQGSAGKLLKDPSLYVNADQMLVESRNLVKAVRENPKRYLTIHFKLF